MAKMGLDAYRLYRFLSGVIFITITIIACVAKDDSSNESHNGDLIDVNDYNFYMQMCNKLGENDNKLFHTLLTDLCSQQLWSARDIYDACHYLMIPMHYSFKSGDYYAIKQFHSLFNRFTYSYKNEMGFKELSRGNRLQWLYLCSIFVSMLNIPSISKFIFG